MSNTRGNKKMEHMLNYIFRSLDRQDRLVHKLYKMYRSNRSSVNRLMFISLLTELILLIQNRRIDLLESKLNSIYKGKDNAGD